MTTLRHRLTGRAGVSLRRLASRAAAALLATSLGAAVADDVPAPGAERVLPGLYRIGGAGGGTLLRLGARGLIVVDPNGVPAYRPLMAEVERIAKPEPSARALVPIAARSAELSNVEQFVDAGVRVIVQRKALPRLARSSGAHGTFVAYDTDYMLRVGDVEAEVEHVGAGRTGVDSIVYFPDLRAVAVGDLYTRETPEPDCASGGSYAGWASAITHLMWFPFDVAVPSRGAPVGKSELAAFKTRLESLAQRAAASGRAGCR